MNNHLTGHFHVQCMAEPLAVVPVHARTDSFEGYGRCRLRANLHSDTVAFQSEAVSQVLNGLNVGYVYGYFVALVHFKFEERCKQAQRQSCTRVLCNLQGCPSRRTLVLLPMVLPRIAHGNVWPNDC